MQTKSEVDQLSENVDAFANSVRLWNNAYIVLLGLTFVASAIIAFRNNALSREERKLSTAKDGQIAAVSKAAGEANERAAKLEKEAAEAKTRLLELQQLTEKPMTLDVAMGNKILDLGKKGSVTIWYTINNEGARALGEALRDVLKEHGWTVIDAGALASPDMTRGLTIRMNRQDADQLAKSPENIPEPAKTLYNCLKDAVKGNPLPVAIADDTGLQNDALAVWIGPKI